MGDERRQTDTEAEMIWVERFDGRWERAERLDEAMGAPVRAFRIPSPGAARRARPRRAPAVLDAATIRGTSADELRRRIAGERRTTERGCHGGKAERSLGPVTHR